MSLSASESRALARHRAVLDTRRAAAAAALIRAWDAQDGYDSTDIDQWLARTAPFLAGAQAATIAASVGFYATLLRTPAVGVDPTLIQPTTDPRAPFLAHWHALNMGRPWEEAIDSGRSTAQALGEDHVTQVARLTGDAFATASGKSLRWQRVAERNPCDWCRQRDGSIYDTAADGDYGHQRCHCDVIPVT